MDRIKSFLERLEEWFIDNDLHIYFGALTIVVVSVLGWMLYTESQKTALLRSTNVDLILNLNAKDRLISKLQMDLVDAQHTVASPVEVKPVVETVDKMSSKLNAKIEKVQSTLINTPSEPKVITKTQIQTVEKPIPVDSELKAMMRQSFCSSFPEDKTCKVNK